MPLRVRSVEIRTGCPDREGLLVFDADELLAILVKLSDMHRGAGMWHLEYGPSLVRDGRPFSGVKEALAWMDGGSREGTRLCGGAGSALRTWPS